MECMIICVKEQIQFPKFLANMRLNVTDKNPAIEKS
jgi:hypothetical protein